MAANPESEAERQVTGRFVVGLFAVALAAAGFSVAFRAMLGFAAAAATGASNIVAAMRVVPVWARVLLPATGGLLAGVVGLWVARARGGQGVGDVMEAVVLGRVKLSMRVTLLKSLASWLAIVFGGSIGREGPLIQFGGAVGKFVSELIKLPKAETRVLIAAGTAAGFAAAYNTPFAAVLFVLEVVTSLVVLDVVLPVIVATVVATAFTRSLSGGGPIYGQRGFVLQSPSELMWFAGLGLVVALGAQGFMRLLSLGETTFQRLPMPWRPAVGGALAGALIAWVPEVAGNGYEPLNEMLDGRFALGFVALLLVAKCFATTASVGSGSPGGVFTPTLLVGGALGLLYGALLNRLGLQTQATGGYALVGMAAAIAATTHAPLMAAVLVFELTGDYDIVLPLVLATAIGTLVSRRLRRESIYTAELRQRGIGWEVTIDGRVHEEVPNEV